MTLETFTILFAELCILITVLTIEYFYRVAEPEDRKMERERLLMQDWQNDLKQLSDYKI